MVVSETPAVLMQLQEEVALSLDDPLSRHLPEVAAALPFGGAISLRQLANHTAGVYSYSCTDNAPGLVLPMRGVPISRSFVDGLIMTAIGAVLSIALARLVGKLLKRNAR